MVGAPGALDGCDSVPSGRNKLWDMAAMMRLRYALLQQWFGVKFWLRWKFNRCVWRSFATVLRRMSPRLRQEFTLYERRAWDTGNASVEFGEWLGRRVWVVPNMVMTYDPANVREEDR